MATPCSTATINKPFRFLDLPPELRVRVYEYCFVGHFAELCLDAHYQLRDALPTIGPRDRHNAILRTSKLVHKGATSVMEESVALTFDVDHAKNLCPQSGNELGVVDPSRLCRARDVTLDIVVSPGWSEERKTGVEKWLVLTNGFLSAKRMPIKLDTFDVESEPDLGEFVDVLRAGLRCDGAKGNVVGTFFDFDMETRSGSRCLKTWLPS